MLKRLVKDIRVHLIQFLHGFQQDRLRAVGDLVLAGGMLYGAAAWPWMKGRQRA